MDRATLLPLMSAADIKLKEKLGKGACATVYKGDIGKKVALKIYSESYTSLCTSEARLLVECAHPNIVRPLGVMRNNGVALVMEYMNGGSLFKLICKQMADPFSRMYSNEDALRWAQEMACALSFLHERSPAIIHRDIKAENVLFYKDGKKRFSKLIDFSLATELNDSKLHIESGAMNLADFSEAFSQPCSPFNSLQITDSAAGTHPSQFHSWWQQNRHTYDSDSSAAFSVHSDSERELPISSVSRQLQSGTTNSASDYTSISNSDICSRASSLTYNLTGQSGSYAYMAPEVFLQQPYNEKVDVFSFGVLLYEIFSRSLVVYTVAREGTEAEMEAFARRVSEGYRLPVTNSIPPSVWSLIQDCWQQDQDSRPSMTEVLERVADLLSEEQARHAVAKQRSASKVAAGFLSRRSCMMSEPQVDEDVFSTLTKRAAGPQLKANSLQSEEGKTCAIM